MSPSHIRIATLNDVNDIMHCAQSAYQRYVARIGKAPAPMVADFASQVSNDWVWIATIENELVGYIVFYPDQHVLHLENVAVLPSHTGKGIGKQLIEFAQTNAAELGLTHVELYTNEKMHENLALYPTLGFVEIERKTQDGFNRVFFSKSVKA